MRRINKALTVILITLLVATFSNINLVCAATTIYVDPPSIKNQAMVPGTRFNITLWVGNVNDLYGYQVKLTFSPAILETLRVIFPPDNVFAGKSPMPLIFIDNTAGYALLGQQLLGDKPRFNGTGKLGIIEFQVKGIGVSALVIHEDTTLLDFDLNPIPYTVTHGLFDNRPPIPDATLYVDPPKKDDPTLIPCSNFDIRIKIANATTVNSFEFKLSYNSSILHAVDVVLGDFFPSATTNKTIDNAAGFVIFSAKNPPSPVTGNGTLAIITFHVEDVGFTALDLADAPIAKLADKDGQPLKLTPSKDGSFKNLKGAKLYVNPKEIVNPLLKPPKIFSVDIVIDDVEDLYGYEFKLSYNTNMLTCIGLAIHPILNEHNFTTNMMVNDDTGQIWVKVKYYSPAIPITTYTPESLVTLTFKVDAIGSSVLDLYDTKLVDPTGGIIPHEVTDGYVQTLIRDVAIINVVPSASFVYAGALVDINVTAKNKGNVTETFDVKAYYNSTLIDTKTVTNLLPNAENILTFTWNTSGVGDGVYLIKGEATFVPYEFNTTDNVYLDSTVEVRTRIRDLAILSVTVNPNVTYAGWPVNITVVAENQGMDPENFKVSVYWNDTNLIGTPQSVTGLAPNTTITLYFIWDTTGAKECHKYKISANATILEFEMDTTDNWLDDGYVKIKIMGDINSDGKVDIKDLAILAMAFGSYPGHPRWMPEADLNRDLKVDIRDITMAARNFGKTCL